MEPPQRVPDPGAAVPVTDDPVTGEVPLARTSPSTGDPAPQVRADPLEVEARKARLRSALRERRRQRDAAESTALDTALARTLLACPLLQGCARVALYASRPGEPGTRSTLDALRRQGVDVLLPVLRADADLDWELRAAAAPARGSHPPRGPVGPHAVAGADLVLVPALAVDTAGRRLGQGGGSYDRALRRVPPRVPVVAVVHDDEVLDAAVSPLPVLPHDRPVQGVVTPTRWLWLLA